MRDLGGYETADGRSLKWGEVFRSGELPHLTDEDVAKWAEFIPARRLGPPAEIAHLAAALLDGECNYYAAQFACMSGGWNGL